MKNHPKITLQYPDKQLTTAFLIAKEPSLCNHSACHGSGSLPNHEPNKENCYSERHNRRPKYSLM